MYYIDVVKKGITVLADPIDSVRAETTKKTQYVEECWRRCGAADVDVITTDNTPRHQRTAVLMVLRQRKSSSAAHAGTRTTSCRPEHLRLCSSSKRNNKFLFRRTNDTSVTTSKACRQRRLKAHQSWAHSIIKLHISMQSTTYTGAVC